MNRSICWVTVLPLLAACAESNSGHSEQVSVQMELGQCVGSAISLKAKLRNHTGGALSFEKGVLPWGSPDSLLLVVVLNDFSGEPLNKRHALVHPGPEEITLQPGAETFGTVDLVAQYPDLPQAIERQEVMVFWSYQPEDAAGKTYPRSAGSLGLRRIGEAGGSCEAF